MLATNVGSVGVNDAPDKPVCAVAERDKYIVSELKRLQGIAERQEMFIKELVSRLSPVTVNEHSDEEKSPLPASFGVPLADDMAIVARRLETTNEILEDLLSRLEI